MPGKPSAATSPGQQLALRRRQLGKTQRQVAEHVGVTAQAVSEWERDGAHPARAYAIAADEFLDAEGTLTAAFGYVTDRGDGQRDGDLRAAIARLTADVRDLAQRVQALERAPARSARSPQPRGRRGSRRSPPPSDSNAP